MVRRFTLVPLRGRVVDHATAVRPAHSRHDSLAPPDPRPRRPGMAGASEARPRPDHRRTTFDRPRRPAFPGPGAMPAPRCRGRPASATWRRLAAGPLSSPPDRSPRIRGGGVGSPPITPVIGDRTRSRIPIAPPRDLVQAGLHRRRPAPPGEPPATARGADLAPPVRRAARWRIGCHFRARPRDLADRLPVTAESRTIRRRSTGRRARPPSHVTTRADAI